MRPLDRMCLERGAQHLHDLGARATAEFLIDVAEHIGGMPCILGRLEEYRWRLTPEMIRAVGADRFPPRQLRGVPR